MPEHLPELRQAWICALRRENIDNLKVVNLCVKHFREEDVEVSHKAPNGDGTFTEIPRAKPKLRDGAQFRPCFLVLHHTIFQPQQANGLACHMTQKMKN